jgi:hypothetical protein
LINGLWDNLVLTNKLAWKLKIIYLKCLLLMASSNQKRCEIKKSLEFYKKLPLHSISYKETARILR